MSTFKNELFRLYYCFKLPLNVNKYSVGKE